MEARGEGAEGWESKRAREPLLESEEAAHEWPAPNDTSPHRNKTPVDAWTSPGTARVRRAGVASAAAEANFEVKTVAAVAVLHTTNGGDGPAGSPHAREHHHT